MSFTAHFKILVFCVAFLNPPQPRSAYPVLFVVPLFVVFDNIPWCHIIHCNEVEMHSGLILLAYPFILLVCYYFVVPLIKQHLKSSSLSLSFLGNCNFLHLQHGTEKQNIHVLHYMNVCSTFFLCCPVLSHFRVQFLSCLFEIFSQPFVAV